MLPDSKSTMVEDADRLGAEEVLALVVEGELDDLFFEAQLDGVHLGGHLEQELVLLVHDVAHVARELLLLVGAEDDLEAGGLAGGDHLLLAVDLRELLVVALEPDRNRLAEVVVHVEALLHQAEDVDRAEVDALRAGEHPLQLLAAQLERHLLALQEVLRLRGEALLHGRVRVRREVALLHAQLALEAAHVL